ADVFTYNWNVPDTASALAVIRITDQNGLTGKSGMFTIVSSKSPFIIVIRPAPGEIIIGGTKFYQISWTGSGIATQKTFALSLDGGLTWNTIGTFSTDAFTYNWNVPDTASTVAVIRITDANGNSGKSGFFTIQSSQSGSGSIVVTHPVPAEQLFGGTLNFQIMWTSTGVAAQKTIELSTDAGVTWTTIGTVTSDVLSYGWNIPNITTTHAFIRITDANGLTGMSGQFSITSSASVSSDMAKAGYAVSNYPNPATSQTTIALTLPVASDITVHLTNALGIEVLSIVQHCDAGSNSLPVNTSSLTAGMYGYTVQAGATRLTGKINIIK
ncbi:MAG: T9SS type A sorting domain-containing protein, partial [Candidatus Kapaibacterium sp.]